MRQAARLPMRSVPKKAQLQQKTRPAAFAAAAQKAVATTKTTKVAGKSRIIGNTFVASRLTPGITEDEVNSYPPDPWVAVNGSYVVSSTNGAIRISNRTGTTISTISSWAFFGVSYDYYYDSDPRILWDAYHGRWVGVEVVYDYPTFADTYLSIAVSDTADPTGSWSIREFSYLDSLPDYPGIASSTDKLILTANEYLGGADYNGSSYLVLPWSTLLSGGAVAASYDGCAPTACWNYRPARLQTNSADIHLVYEYSDGFVYEQKLSGSATAPTLGTAHNLGIAAGSDPFHHDPRQPGDVDGIVDATDSRIPDAVWANNTLMFARTVDHTYDAGTHWDLAIEAVAFNTSTLVAPTDWLFTTQDTDQFLPGVGFSTNGTAFVTYSSSSDSAAPSIMATASDSAFVNDWQTITVAGSDANYTGQRWGDFAGIAADPAGSGSVWIEHQVGAGDGSWKTYVARLAYDGTVPVVSTPKATLVAGTQVTSSKVPVKVTWSDSDPETGIDMTHVGMAEGGGSMNTIYSGTGTSTYQSVYWVPYGYSYPYQFAIAAMNGADMANVSTWSTGFSATVYDETGFPGYTWSSGWTKASSTAYLGKSDKYSSTAGKSVSFKASGRSFAWVGYRSSKSGKAKVYVDGVLKATVTLTSSTTKARNLVWVSSLFASNGTHTIKIVVVSGRVDVDAFLVLR